MATVRKKAVRGEARTKEYDEPSDEVKDIWSWTVEWQHFKDAMLCSGADEFDNVHGTDRSVKAAAQTSGGRRWKHTGRTQALGPRKPCAAMAIFCGTWSIGALGKAGAIPVICQPGRRLRVVGY